MCPFDWPYRSGKRVLAARRPHRSLTTRVPTRRPASITGGLMRPPQLAHATAPPRGCGAVPEGMVHGDNPSRKRRHAPAWRFDSSAFLPSHQLARRRVVRSGFVFRSTSGRRVPGGGNPLSQKQPWFREPVLLGHRFDSGLPFAVVAQSGKSKERLNISRILPQARG